MLMAYSGLSSLCHGLQTLDRRRNVVELGGELLLVLLQGPEKLNLMSVSSRSWARHSVLTVSSHDAY